MDIIQGFEKIWNGEISEESIYDYDIVFNDYKYITDKILSSPSEIAHLSENCNSFNWRFMGYSEENEKYTLDFKSPFIFFDMKLYWIEFQICIFVEKPKRASDSIKYMFNLYDTCTGKYRDIRPSIGIELYSHILTTHIRSDEFFIDYLINSCNYNQSISKGVDYFISKESKWISLNKNQYDSFSNIFKQSATVISVKKYDVCSSLRLFLVTGITSTFIPKCITMIFICTANKTRADYIEPYYYKSSIPIDDMKLNDGLSETKPIKYPLLVHENFKDALKFPYCGTEKLK